MQRILLGALFAVAVLASACAGSVEFSVGGQTVTEAAEELIESDEMFQRLNVEPIVDAVCAEPAVQEVGAIFECTATSGENQIVFEVDIESESRIFAGPKNVIDSGLLDAYAQSAVDALNAQNDFTLPDGSIDCGDRSVVLDADNKMYCVLDEPTTNTTFSIEFTVRDIETAAFGVEIVEIEE